jgi:predicted nucleic acid-binding protein
MNITELHNLPAVEKLKIIEALWGDLVVDESSLPNLAWHETELKETEEKFQAGSIEVLDWQQAKKELCSQVRMT